MDNETLIGKLDAKVKELCALLDKKSNSTVSDIAGDIKSYVKSKIDDDEFRKKAKFWSVIGLLVLTVIAIYSMITRKDR